jgi:general nucleoside transport system ATP-binding protein
MGTQPVRLDGGDVSQETVPAVEFLGVSKRFGAVTACDKVDLELHRGRIHGILGENGAGKSTLMKILIGLVLPDEGQLKIHGETCAITDPTEAATRGIGMVHQHFSLVDALSVWQNVALGDQGRLDPTKVRNLVGDISTHYGLEVDPDAIVADLPAGLRQRVEIIKCLRRDPEILIFDEPTSVLTPHESAQLFESLRKIVDEEGRAVALVSHKLGEILRATDEVSIMREGVVVDRFHTRDADAPMLARAMVGRDVSLRSEQLAVGSSEDDSVAGGPETGSEIVLRLDKVIVKSRGAPPLLDGLSLEVAAGEIVGVAGVEGNGQRTLGDLLSSLVPVQSGTIEVKGKMVQAGTAGAMARAGVGVIPEDRHDSGVVLDLSVAQNLFMVNPRLISKRGIIDVRLRQQEAARLIEEFEISCAGSDAPMWSLSGGNQQRVVLAREISAGPAVLVAAQPTRGLDVGAIEYMAERIRDVAERGIGVLLISSELEEIFDLADRILVLYRGKVAGQMSRRDADLETVGLLMGGAST